MKETRIIVTGGSGFIGTNLIDQLIIKYNDLINIDIKPPKKEEHIPFWKQCDVLDSEQLISIIDNFQPNVVVHLAAKTDLNGKSLSDYSANINGVSNLITASSKCKALELVLFTSTRLVNRIGYQPKSEDDYSPTTFYGESKMLGEKIIRASSPEMSYSWMILRPTSIWGPWFGTPYNDFFMTIIRSLYFHPRNYLIKKSFGYIGNTVYELEKLINHFPVEFNRRTLYLCDYQPIDVYNWAKQIAELQGVRPPLEVTLEFLKFIAKIGDGLKKMGYKEPPLTSFRLNNIVTDMIYDTKDLESFCGPLPFSEREGIITTLEWLNKNK